MIWLCALLLGTFESSAKEPKKIYAPNFILPAFDLQKVMDRFGTVDVKLSQYVGLSSTKETYQLIVVMGEEKTAIQDLKKLKSVYKKALEKKIDFVVLYASNDSKFRNDVNALNLDFVVVRDPFRVVRNRYQYIDSRFCYVVDVHGQIQQDQCLDIDDVLSFVKK
jgi:hypothetical protein